MKSILITGGTGYVGGRLCEHLSKFGEYKIYVATRYTKVFKNSDIQFVKIDWNNNCQLKIFVKKWM